MKMKKQLTLLALGLFAVSCSVEEELQITPEVSQSEVSYQDINLQISKSLQANDQFYWSTVSSEYISSAANLFDSTLTIGYQPTGFQDLNSQLHTIDIHSSEWVAAKKAVIAEIEKVYDDLGLSVNIEDKIVKEHDVLPYFHIQATEVAVIEGIRNLSSVRYVEPRSYDFVEEAKGTPNKELSDSGCGGDNNPSINTADYRNISPNAKLPWTYDIHNIPAAWAYSTGDNIGVGLIDTGLSPNQAKLGSQFASGYSTNRSVNKYGTFVDSWWPWSTNTDGPNDKCGHGTSMAGAIASPRNSDGMAVGVAYNANLYSVRAVEDVIISSGHEKDGVSDAYVLLANKSNVKVISMSLGSPFGIGQVEDAIRYAYGRGKLIFNAAGTSTSYTTWYGVIFPAWMNETVAVTGIKDNGYNKCDVCHEGSAVDFVVTMQRASSGSRTSLTLPQNGSGTEYVGGSSVATAMTAGTAALVWAQNPSWSRNTVLDKMKRASEFYPSRSNKHGWGKINVLQAVTN